MSFPEMGAASRCELLEFTCTEEAVRFGQSINREQFIYISGARKALQELFNEAAHFYGSHVAQMQAELAVKIQLLRECLESASDQVRMSVIGLGLVEADEPMEAGRL